MLAVDFAGEGKKRNENLIDVRTFVIRIIIYI
jgi:hypothetical protein